MKMLCSLKFFFSKIILLFPKKFYVIILDKGEQIKFIIPITCTYHIYRCIRQLAHTIYTGVYVNLHIPYIPVYTSTCFIS